MEVVLLTALGVGGATLIGAILGFVFKNYSSVELDDKERQDYIHGKQVKVDKSRITEKGDFDDICVYHGGELLAIAQKQPAGNRIWLKPFRFFGD